MAKYIDLFETMISAALSAGDFILSHYNENLTVELKTDQSPVTIADRGAEDIIVRALIKYAPDIPIIAEERMACGIEPEIDGKPFFLVDPLDGTREFIAHNGEFTVNIALIENGYPVLGVVYVPIRATLYTGKHNVAEKIIYVDGKPASRHIIQSRKLAFSPVALTSRSHISEVTKKWLRDKKIKESHAIGSSLKLCLLAEGHADIYPRMEHCMEWDTAAGDAVLRSAGGCIHTLFGKPLTYGKRNRADIKDFVQDPFIACGDKNKKL